MLEEVPLERFQDTTLLLLIFFLESSFCSTVIKNKHSAGIKDLVAFPRIQKYTFTSRKMGTRTHLFS